MKLFKILSFPFPKIFSFLSTQESSLTSTVLSQRKNTRLLIKTFFKKQAHRRKFTFKNTMAEILSRSFIHRIHLISYSFEITVAICTFRLHRDSISPGKIHPKRFYYSRKGKKRRGCRGVEKRGDKTEVV